MDSVEHLEDVEDVVERSLALIKESEELLAPTGSLDESSEPTAEDLRRQIAQVLADTGEDLHRNVGMLGGLSTLLKSNPDKYPERFQEAATLFKGLGERRAVIESTLKTALDDALEDLLFAALRLKADINRAVQTDHDLTVKDKVEKSVKAVKAAMPVMGSGLGLEAQEAIQSMVRDWKVLKITDSPNPYFIPKPEKSQYDDPMEFMAAMKKYRKKLQKFEELGLEESMAELYGPAHRYIHVDGDEFVNGAKSAATERARDQLRRDIDVEKIEREIREKHEAKLTGEMLEKRRQEAEEAISVEMMADWLKAGGAKLLRGLGAGEAADAFASGDFSARDGLDVEVAEALLKAQQEFFSGLSKNPAFVKRVDEEVESARPVIERRVEVKIDSLLTRAKRKAGWDVEGTKALEVPDYWVEVGRLALQSEYGRCFSCAGAAIFKLAMNPAFDDAVIESVGSPDFDHHFVFVGRSNAGSTEPPTNPKTLVIDVWQANQGGDPPATTWETFTYNESSSVKIFAVLRPKDRAELRKRFGG